ncbi:thermonuclease family protein [Mesorhizobium sp.]|uniref:thermonuclease family protein n=1 Tax=Mesorhizobium sp. TaxID=1871066 RepID=UPI0025C0D2E9|nr:thermonuclease family protein [Mesorhizobium sp.]
MGWLAAFALFAWYYPTDHKRPISQVVPSADGSANGPLVEQAPTPAEAIRQAPMLRTTTAIDLRSEPTSDSPIIMILGPNVPVKVMAQSGQWHEVSVASKTGWIERVYLAENDPRQATARKSADPAVIQGSALAVDGDTIEINGTRVRLNGIDAPEYDQQCEDAKHFTYSCGWQITSSLGKFLAKSKPIRCEFVTWDQYGRFVGNCTRADGTDVASWLVKNGLALDWPKYSHGAYASQQSAAKASKLGVWKGLFEEPWSWRAEQAERSAVAKQGLGIMSSQAQASGGYSCEPRRTCSQIGSCKEANWYLSNCSWGGKLDRDNDGIPCESLC